MPKPNATASESYEGPAMGRCSAPATATEQPTKTRMNVPTSSATSGGACAPPVLLLYSAISTSIPQGLLGYLPSDRRNTSEPTDVPPSRSARPARHPDFRGFRRHLSHGDAQPGVTKQPARCRR